MQSKHYKRLLKLNKIIQQRDQALLSNALNEKHRLQSEQHQLLAMHEKPAEELLISHNWISQKMKRNTAQSQVVSSFIHHQQQETRQTNRRCDLLLDKYKSSSDKEYRQLLSTNISEYLATKKY